MKARRSIHKFLAMLLCLAMVVGMIPTINLFPTAQAAEAEGVCSESHDHSSGWQSLNEAYANASVSEETGDKFGFVNISGNFYLTEDLELNKGAIRFNGATHLDLNGFTVKAKTGVTYQNNTLLHVAATFTLCDSSEEQTGAIDGLYNGTEGSGAALDVLVRVYYTTATMYGGIIKGLCTSAERSGAVRIDGPSRGTFVMEGGKITGNMATKNRSAGAVTCETGTTFTMNGGEISGNQGSEGSVGYANGGAVTLYAGGNTTTFNMTGGTITGNTAYRGGAVWAYGASGTDKAVINISGGEISGNTETDTSNQGDVYFNTSQSELHISGNPVINNVKCSNGTADIGALTEGANITSATQLTVKDNTVSQSGNVYTYKAPEPEPTEPPATEPPVPDTPAVDDPAKGCCDGHDTTHEGWMQLGDPENPDAVADVKESDIRSNASGKYVLVSDVHMSGTMWLHAYGSQNIHICLNGHTLTSAAATIMSLPAERESLTICDCQGGGKIDCSKGSGTADGAIISGARCTINLYGGTITGINGSVYGAITANSDNSVINMYGGAITGNTLRAGNGGGICMNKGKLTVYGGNISDNTVTGNGGGIYVADYYSSAVYHVSANIKGGTIDNVYQAGQGVVAISGNPEIDSVVAAEGAKAATVGALTAGASIYSATELSTADDGTVLVHTDSETGINRYTYLDPAMGCCDGHDTTHEGWFQLGDPENPDAVADVTEGSIRGSENGKYVLASDVHLSGTMWLHAFTNKNIHICLNGHTLTCAATPVMCIPGNIESLTICDCQGGGKIDCSKGTNVNGSYNQGVIIAGAKSTINLYGGTITGINGTVPSVIASNSDNAVVNMYGGSITDNVLKAGNNGAFGINHGKFTMYGGNISNNTVGDNSVGIYVGDFYSSATYHVAVDIQGGTIDGDVYQAGQGVLTISGNPVIDAVVVANGAKVPTVSALTEGASIYAKNELSAADDGTILGKIDAQTGLYLYKYVDGQAGSFGLKIQAAEGVIDENNQIKVEVGSDPTALSIVYEDYFDLAEGSYTLSWSSDDSRVATVDENGTVTYVGIGATAIRVAVLDELGQPTEYCAYVNVQVGDYLKVLMLGNDSSRDSMFYLGKLAELTGQKIQAAYLYDKDANLRDHAHNLGLDLGVYTYYSTFVGTGEMELVAENVRAIQVLKDNDWDVVILQHGVTVGWSSTYNSDLEYLIDYIHGEEPGAKLYWNMTWANQADCTSNYANFSTYDKNQQLMYNAIVSCLEEYVIGENSRYGSGFDGYILTGAAIQNLRATYGDILTRDGYHLTLKAGRLTAALTMLQELASDEELALTVDMSKITVAALGDILAASDGSITADAYDNTQANLDKVNAAVQAACTTVIPAKFEDAATPDVSANADFMIGYVDLPNYLIQPDIIALPDGTYIAYGAIGPAHADSGDGQTGSVQTVFFKGEVNEDGDIIWDFANPTLTINEDFIEAMGIVKYSDRYARVKNGEVTPAAAAINSTFGECNFDIIYLDHDGNPNTEEVATLTVTCWGNYICEGGSLSRRGFMVWSFDCGETWPGFQMMETSHNNPVLKRGSMAIFDNDQLLMPYYGYGYNGCLLLGWNPVTQQWDLKGDYDIPNLTPEEMSYSGSADYTEIALVAPDPSSNIVFAITRCSGTILKSEDRGQTWEKVGNEPLTVDQPSFIVLDDERVFVIWSKKPDARKIYGKVFYVNGDWTDTESILIYETPLTTHHDVGGPHAAIVHGSELGSEQMIAVAYDAAFTGIPAVMLDLSDSKWLPIELQNTAASVIADLTVPVTGTYTVEAQVKFTAADSSVTINTSAGPLTVEAGSFALNETVNIRASVVGGAIYWKAWQGDTEPAEFQYKNGQRDDTALTEISCSGAESEAFIVSKNISITMTETAVLTEGGSSVQLEATVMPVQNDMVWSSSDEDVATVDQNGLVTPVAEGTCEIYLVAGGVTGTCRVTVNGKPAELTGEGQKNYIVNDDFEGYEVSAEDLTKNNDAFWITHWEDSDNSDYHFNVAEDAKGETAYYNIKEENGNQYLELVINGALPWFMNSEKIYGNFTVQFDFRLNPDGHANDRMNTVPFENLNDAGNPQKNFEFYVNLQNQGITVENLIAGSKTEKYPNLYNKGEWMTYKLVAIEGAVYVKVWPQGTAEPAEWNVIVIDGGITNTVGCYYRFNFASLNANTQTYFDMDNLTISQQVEVPSAVEATRMELDNSLNMQFSVPMDQQTDWTGAYAEIKRGSETTTVPYAKWITLDTDNLYVVPFEGVAAKEMTDEVVVTIYDAEGNQIGASYTDSIRAYAMRILADQNEQAAWTMMVDMLNYGAAAQEFFGYKTGDLANAELTEAQKDLATQGKVDVTSEAMSGTISRLNLESRIELQIVIPEAYKGQTIRYSFTNHYNESKSGTPEVKLDSATGYSYIAIDQIVVADANQMVGVFAGDTKIAEDSVASYIARMDGSDSTTDPLYQTIMKFANAAKEYFALNNIGEE